MTLFKNKYRIESTRLKGWDYRNPGYYFVTICTKNRNHYFGAVENDDVTQRQLKVKPAPAPVELADRNALFDRLAQFALDRLAVALHIRQQPEPDPDDGEREHECARQHCPGYRTVNPECADMQPLKNGNGGHDWSEKS